MIGDLVLIEEKNGGQTLQVLLINNQTTRPSFLRADSQRGAAELIARRKRGRVV